MTDAEETEIRAIARTLLRPIYPSLAAVALEARRREKHAKRRNRKGQFSGNWPRSKQLAQCAIAGREAHRRGTAHQWTREEARAAALKGVEARRRRGLLPR